MQQTKPTTQKRTRIKTETKVNSTKKKTQHTTKRARDNSLFFHFFPLHHSWSDDVGRGALPQLYVVGRRFTQRLILNRRVLTHTNVKWQWTVIIWAGVASTGSRPGRTEHMIEQTEVHTREQILRRPRCRKVQKIIEAMAARGVRKCRRGYVTV